MRSNVIDESGPAKPAHGSPCNGCGVCCVAEPCLLALDFVPAGRLAAAVGAPCPALEWGEGRAWCGLVSNPEKHSPLLAIAAYRCEFGKEIGFLLIILEMARCLGILESGVCDAGPDDPDDDVELGVTAHQHFKRSVERPSSLLGLRR